MSVPRVLLSITTPDEGSVYVQPIPSAEDPGRDFGVRRREHEITPI